jgi:uncharacterized membrane protein
MTDSCYSTCRSESFKQAVMQAIASAEKKTSGEIKIHIEKTCATPVLDRATTIFAKLGMHQTKLRNGVLLYIAAEDHKLAVIGDVGINQFVSMDFWEKLKANLILDFQQANYQDSVCFAIDEIGLALSEFFPWQFDDLNELSNEISYE